jgi:hypothetical protein
VDATGQFLYVGQDIAASGIVGFKIIPNTGVLTPLLGSPFVLGAAQVRASSTGGFLVGVQEGAGGTTLASDKHIAVFSINAATGAPTGVVGSPFSTATGNAPFDVVIAPNGLNVYALEANTATASVASIEGFTLNPGSGGLASLGTFNGVPTAEACRIDQSGVALFCANVIGGGTLTVNSVNPGTGAVVHVADLTVASGTPLAATD